MKTRIAVVQPASFFGDQEYLNAQKACEYVKKAKEAGAQLVCFPEGYPGPYSGPIDSGGYLKETPINMLRTQAKESGIYVVAGCVEPAKDYPGCFRLSEKLIGPDGSILGNYYRIQPNHPLFNEFLMGGKTDIVPGEDFVLVDTPIGVIGLLICSELWVPELSRILMLRGADIIIAGGGGVHSATRTKLTDTWRCIARARAAENIVYVAMNQNIFRENTKGRACIAGPEEMLASRDDSGIIIADIDLDRLNYLRSRFYDEEILSSPPDENSIYKSRPGQNHDRRPEKYHDLICPQNDAFDYCYMHNKKPWRDEYEKIKMKLKPII